MMIHQDHFIPVADSVGIEMVRVSHSQVRVSPCCSSFGHALEGDRPSELGNSHCLLSSSRNRSWFPRTSTSYSDSNQYNSGFRFVSQSSRSYKSSRPRDSLHDGLSSPACCGPPKPVSEIRRAVAPPTFHVRIRHEMQSRDSRNRYTSDKAYSTD